MQTNPVVVDGVLYATTPKLRVFALDAATGKELWSFDPNAGAPPTSRIRHRGVVVTGDRVLFNYRNRLYALDKRTGQPIRTFGDTGWVDLRAGLGRPVEGLSVSASTPGVVFEDCSSWAAPSPKRCRARPATFARTTCRPVRCGGASTPFRIPASPATRPGPPTRGRSPAARTRGPASRSTPSAQWCSPRPARRRTTSTAPIASATTCSRTACSPSTRARGSRIWHYQVLKHDLWDRDLPAAPALVTVTHDGKPIDAVAQITKTGHVWVFDRETGTPLFPVADRAMPAATLRRRPGGDDAALPRASRRRSRASSSPAPISRRARRAAHAAALKLFEEYGTKASVRSAEREGHDHLPRRRRRWRMGRPGVRSQRRGCST